MGLSAAMLQCTLCDGFAAQIWRYVWRSLLRLDHQSGQAM